VVRSTPKTRYVEPTLLADLPEKMVFLGGPRQVGKTTLAKSLMLPNALYLNWDDAEDRSRIMKREWSRDVPMLVLDEVHKYRLWRGLVKGLFDKRGPDLKILVTGSARLDHFRKGGDSLVGRYHYHRLHPFTLGEAGGQKALPDLLRYGGFPEPFLKQDQRFYRRWQKERVTRVVTQDLRDLENVKEISLVELLAELLPARVGSPLSIRSLQEDLQVSPHTVERWITIFENLYLCYRIAPHGAERAKAVKKAKKLYLWDWAQVESEGPRFENLVASHLLKYCHAAEDSEGHRMELRYLRDVDGKEIDFLVLRARKPVFAVECKSGERRISKHLAYFKERYRIPKAYQVHGGEADFGDEAREGRVLPLHRLCELEQLP
jgi:uncharacterized protein